MKLVPCSMGLRRAHEIGALFNGFSSTPLMISVIWKLTEKFSESKIFIFALFCDPQNSLFWSLFLEL